MWQCFYGSFDDAAGYHVLSGSDNLPEGLSDFIKRNSEVCGPKEGTIGQKILTMLPYEKYFVFFHYTRQPSQNEDIRKTGFLHQLIFEADELEKRLRQDNFFLARLKFCEHLTKIHNYGNELQIDTKKQLEIPTIDSEVFKDMLKRLLYVENKKQLFLVFPDNVAQDYMDEKSRTILSILLYMAGRDAWANMSFSTWMPLTLGNDLIRRLSIVCCTMKEARKYYERYPDKACYFLTDENKFWGIAETRPYQAPKALVAGAEMKRERTRTEGDFPAGQMDRDKTALMQMDQCGEKSTGDAYGGSTYRDDRPFPPWGETVEREGRNIDRETETFFYGQREPGSAGTGQMEYNERQVEKRVDPGDGLYPRAFRLLGLSAVCMALSIFMFLGTIILNINERKQLKEQKAYMTELYSGQDSSTEMKALALRIQELKRSMENIETMLKKQQEIQAFPNTSGNEALKTEVEQRINQQSLGDIPPAE